MCVWSSSRTHTYAQLTCTPPLPLQVGPSFPPVELNPDGSLCYGSVQHRYLQAMDWLAGLCEFCGAGRGVYGWGVRSVFVVGGCAGGWEPAMQP